MKSVPAAAKRTRRWQADPRAFSRLLARIEPFTPTEVTEIALPVRIAYEALRTGRAEANDFDMLALSTPKQMQDAMREVLRRVEARQVYGSEA